MPPGLSPEGLKCKSFNLTLQKVKEQYVPAIATARVVILSPGRRIYVQVEKPQGSVRSFVEGVLSLLKDSEALPPWLCPIREKLSSLVLAWLIRPSPSVIHDIFNRESILGPVFPLLPQPGSLDASMLTIGGDDRIVARFYDETAFFPRFTFGLPSPLWGG